MNKKVARTMTYAKDARLFQKVESVPGEQALYEMARNEIANELGNLSRPATVIDFCCGTCEIFSRMIPEPRIRSFIGIDIEKSYLEFAAERLRDIEGVELVEGDAASCHLGASADIVIASSAYHHIEDERKPAFLRNMIKHLKPDGKVVFAENILPKCDDHAEAARIFYGKRIEEAKGMGMDEEVITLLQQVMEFEINREYEWKVDYQQFMNGLERAGLAVLRKTKVWPVSFRFDDPLAGDYVVVAKVADE